MIPVEEALSIVLREAPPLPGEHVPLEASPGRVLAEDVRSDVEMPPFDRAAMDGYAVRAVDVARAPATLQIVGEVPAGSWPEREVGAGEAVRIMTGAPVPPGATAVQQVEKTRSTDEFRVTILESVPEGANVAPRGSEVGIGDLLLEAGRIIDASAVAVLAAAGRDQVPVGQRPRVALLATGDELVPVSAVPGPGQIRNSNGPAVACQARQAGAEVRMLGVARDDMEALRSALEPALDADVLIVSGGVSVGDFDLVEPALEELGFSFLFTKVAVKPGAPLVFGRRDQPVRSGASAAAGLVFGLPGNPVSSQVTFDLFVRPALLRMQGARVVGRPTVEVELAGPLTNRSGRMAHLPARIRHEAGRFVASPVPSMGSGDLAAHARANALVVLEATRTRAEPGETAPAVLLGRFLEDDGAPS